MQYSESGTPSARRRVQPWKGPMDHAALRSKKHRLRDCASPQGSICAPSSSGDRSGRLTGTRRSRKCLPRRTKNLRIQTVLYLFPGQGHPVPVVGFSPGKVPSAVGRGDVATDGGGRRGGGDDGKGPVKSR